VSLPGNPIVTETTCAGSSTTCERRCRNPLYAQANPETCVTVTVESLRIEPEDGETTVDRRAVLRVVATFNSGAEVDVTSYADVSTETDALAEYLGDGVVKGVAEGVLWIDASYGGVSARGTLTVAESGCEAEGSRDVVLVLDTTVLGDFAPTSDIGDPYWAPVGETNSLHLKFIADAIQQSLSLKSTLDADDVGGDRIAVVYTGPSGPVTLSDWTDTVVDVSIPGYQGAKVGHAMDEAETLLGSARSAATKIMVVVTGGAETSCNPSISAAAASAIAAGFTVAILTPVQAASDRVSACSNPTKTYAYLQDAASDSAFFGGATNATVGATANQLIRTLCGD
jgi:hypothetical protein